MRSWHAGGGAWEAERGHGYFLPESTKMGDGRATPPARRSPPRPRRGPQLVPGDDKGRSRIGLRIVEAIDAVADPRLDAVLDPAVDPAHGFNAGILCDLLARLPLAGLASGRTWVFAGWRRLCHQHILGIIAAFHILRCCRQGDKHREHQGLHDMHIWYPTPNSRFKPSGNSQNGVGSALAEIAEPKGQDLSMQKPPPSAAHTGIPEICDPCH